ncbi:MAG: TolC family protein [Fimbriimonadaceae bacterium]
MKPFLVLPICLLARIAAPQTSHLRISGPLSIDDAIRAALSNNPALAAARSGLDAARAGLRAAKARLTPQLSANSSATAGSYSTIFGSSPGVMPPAWLTVPGRGYLDQNVTLMVPLYTGGKLQAGVKSATWQDRAAQGELAEMEGDVALAVRVAYLKALVDNQMSTVQKAKVAAVQELLRTTQAKFDAGKEIAASLQRVHVELSRAKRALANARNEAAKAVLNLDAAMGVDFESPISLSDGLSLTADPGTTESFVRIANASRGELIAARARAEAIGADIHVARAQRAPQLYAQASVDAASDHMGSGASLGLTLSIPLFDGGRISADESEANAQRAKALAEVSETEVAVENEVRQAELDIATSRANAALAAESVVAAQSAYDVVSLRVSSGKGILLEELDALEAVTEARGDLAQAVYEHSLAVARLARAAGGAK